MESEKSERIRENTKKHKRIGDNSRESEKIRVKF